MLFARQFEREEWDTLWMHLSPFCLSKGQALLHKVPVPSDHCGGKSVPVVILSGLLFCLRITACSLTGDCDLVSDTFAPADWGLPHVKNWMTAGCPDLSVSLIQVTFLIYQPFTTHKGLGDREDRKTLGVRYLPSCNPVQTAQVSHWGKMDQHSGTLKWYFSLYCAYLGIFLESKFLGPTHFNVEEQTWSRIQGWST